MAYENYVKQTFVDYPDADATVLKKEHLDHIEDGIVALEGQAAQIESDVTLIKQSGAPSVSAERFEAGENANLSPLETRGGVEIIIMTQTFNEDGSVEATYESEYVFDGYAGAAGPQGEPGAAGKDGADGKTPVKGTDYYTEAEKQELIDEVVAAISASLPTSAEGVLFG